MCALASWLGIGFEAQPSQEAKRRKSTRDWSQMRNSSFKHPKPALRSGLARVQAKNLGEVGLG